MYYFLVLVLGICLFLFVLSCFTPTAVTQVIPFWFLNEGTSAYSKLLQVSSPHLTTKISALSFPFFPIFPGSGYFGACFHLATLVLSMLRFLSPICWLASQQLISIKHDLAVLAFLHGLRFRRRLLGIRNLINEDRFWRFLSVIPERLYRISLSKTNVNNFFYIFWHFYIYF